MICYRKERAWSLLLRLFHWTFAVSIVFLVVTGLYIHDPWTNSMIEGGRGFPMADMRLIHFIAGFAFTGAVLARVYLLVFGNKQERILDFAPVTRRNIENFTCTLAYYACTTDALKHRLGHNALAGLAYLVTLFLALGQLLSGFYMLYPESAAWQNWGLALFGPQQQARYIHYLIMWYFMIFAAVHVYIVIWNDWRSPEGLISSIFNGDKFFPTGTR